MVFSERFDAFNVSGTEISLIFFVLFIIYTIQKCISIQDFYAKNEENKEENKNLSVLSSK